MTVAEGQTPPGDHGLSVRGVVVLSVVSALAAIALTSCTSSPAAIRSNTPALSIGGGTTSENNAMFTTAELRAIPGAPAKIEVDRATQAASLFEDPGQIGPCGEKISLPHSTHTAVRQFSASMLDGFELVIDAPVALATSFVTAWQDDTRPGCPPSKSVTNTGSTQTQALVASIPVPSLDDQESGVLLKLTSMGRTFGAYGFGFRVGGRLEFDVVFATQPLSTTFGQRFTLQAEQQLKASVVTST